MVKAYTFLKIDTYIILKQFKGGINNGKTIPWSLRQPIRSWWTNVSSRSRRILSRTWLSSWNEDIIQDMAITMDTEDIIQAMVIITAKVDIIQAMVIIMATEVCIIDNYYKVTLTLVNNEVGIHKFSLSSVSKYIISSLVWILAGGISPTKKEH